MATLSLTPSQLDAFTRKYGVTFRPDGGVIVRRNGREGSFGPSSDIAAYWQQILVNEFPDALRSRRSRPGSNLPLINEAPASAPTRNLVKEYLPMKTRRNIDTALLASVPLGAGEVVVHSDAYKANPLKLASVPVASGERAVHLLTTNNDRDEVLGTTAPHVGEAHNTGGRIASRVELVPLESEVIAAARETSRTPAAAPTAWGTSAPEYTIAFDRSTPSLTRVPVYINVDDSVWSSAGEAKRIVDTVLRQDVARAVDAYLLSNTGSTGIEDDSDVPTFAKSGSRFDAVLKAVTQVRGNGFDGVVTVIVSPTDHLAMLTEVDGDVRVYRSEILKDLGVEVTNSSSAPSGTAVVGSLSESVTMWVDSVAVGTVDSKEQIARVLVSNSHGTNFLNGRVTVLATANVHSRVQRPSGLVTITSF